MLGTVAGGRLSVERVLSSGAASTTSKVAQLISLFIFLAPCLAAFVAGRD